MKSVTVYATCFSVLLCCLKCLAFPIQSTGDFIQQDVPPSNSLMAVGTSVENPVWDIAPQIPDVVIGPHHHRQPRAVNLGLLRRLVNNVALSEFYRLRGLEVMDSLGLPEDQVTSASSSPSTALLQSRILQKLRDSYRRDKTMNNILTYLHD